MPTLVSREKEFLYPVRADHIRGRLDPLRNMDSIAAAGAGCKRVLVRILLRERESAYPEALLGNPFWKRISGREWVPRSASLVPSRVLISTLQLKLDQ